MPSNNGLPPATLILLILRVVRPGPLHGYAMAQRIRALSSRDAWGWNWLDDATQDFAIGVRTLLRSPVFAVTATLILSFGIGLLNHPELLRRFDPSRRRPRC